MELYAAHPPLSEIERGFVGLEVLSFSREKVMVRMDYRYVQPSASFYLAVSDNEVVVYLEDIKNEPTGSVRLVAQWNRFLAVRLRRKIYQS